MCCMYPYRFKTSCIAWQLWPLPVLGSPRSPGAVLLFTWEAAAAALQLLSLVWFCMIVYSIPKGLARSADCRRVELH